MWWKVDFIQQPAITSSVVGPRRSPKTLPKAKKRSPKKRSWSLFGGLLSVWSTTAFWILEKPLHLRSMLSGSMRATMLAAGIDQQKGPSSSPGRPLTTCHTTSASKVEQIGLWSFASSAIFTWPVFNELLLFQASRQLFAGKMLPQSAGGRKCFPRVHSTNLFLIGKNVLTVMVPSLKNKSVFEPSYDDLKFMVWNHNYFFTNLNIMPLSRRDLGVSPASVGTHSIDAKPSLLSTEVLCRFYICRWQKLSQLSSFKFRFTFSSHIHCAKLRETLESLYWWFQVTISWKLENTS